MVPQFNGTAESHRDDWSYGPHRIETAKTTQAAKAGQATEAAEAAEAAQITQTAKSDDTTGG
jgi:hypothetical protein